MTTLDPRALDHATSEFIRTFDPPRLTTGDPETDRSDYAAAVGEALEGAIETYLQETTVNDAPVTLADFLEPDDDGELTGYAYVKPWSGR